MSAQGQTPQSRNRRTVEYIDENGNPLSGPGAASSRVYGAPTVDGRPAFVVRSFTIGGASAGSPTGGLLGSVWHVGIVTGLLGMLLGLAMIALTSGVAAVIFWPLGTFMLVTGGSVLWATLVARRATRALQDEVGGVHTSASTQRLKHEQE